MCVRMHECGKKKKKLVSNTHQGPSELRRTERTGAENRIRIANWLVYNETNAHVYI